MKVHGPWAVVVVLTVLVSGTRAGTFPGSTARGPLAVGSVSERLSVGMEYERIKREVDLKGGGDVLIEADSLSGYVGFDVKPWLTVFVTVGGTELKSEPGLDTDAGLKVSGGVSAYLWEADLLTPPFMAGRFSVKATAEVGRFESDTDMGKVYWSEALAALPVGYEKFDRYLTGASGVETSLALYAGPAVSYLRGKAKDALGNIDFEGKETVGLIAGADVYFSPQLSVGAKVLVFDETSYGASLRFHF